MIRSKLVLTYIAIFCFSLLFPSLLFASGGGSDYFYDAPGTDPYRKTVSLTDYENIDPYTGGLTLNFVDMRLPGNGGLDLVVQRSYNSKNTCRSWQSDPVSVWCDPGGYEVNSWVGEGWSLHFGKLLYPQNIALNNPIIEMPDGSLHEAFYDIAGGGGYITKEYWKLAIVNSVWTLTFTDGKKISFGNLVGSEPPYYTYNNYYATRIEDVSGNYMTIDYFTSSPVQPSSVKKVTEYPLNRVTNFYLTASPKPAQGLYRLDHIARPDGKQIIFQYDPVAGSSTLATLKSVTMPGVGNPWSFVYDTGIQELTQIKTPYGGTIDYTYDTSSLNYNVQGNLCQSNFRSVKTKKVSGTNIATGTWTFSYFQGANNEYTNIVDSCGRTTKYRHYGYNSGLTGGQMWKLGLPISKETPEETTTYSWASSTSAISNDPYNGPTCGFSTLNDVQTFVPYFSSEKITRDGRDYTTTYSSFDSYGNPKSIDATGDETRTTSVDYYWYDTSKNIVKGKPHKMTITGTLTGSFDIISDYFITGARVGKLQTLTTYGLAIDYDYYTTSTTASGLGYGNLMSETDAENRKKTYEWENGQVQNTIVSGPSGTEYKICRDISNMGLPNYSIEGRDSNCLSQYKTSYTYTDNLQIETITPPVGNITTYVYNYTIAPTPFNIQKKRGSVSDGYFVATSQYDGLGRLTQTSDTSGVTTTTSYSACALKDYEDSSIGDKVEFDNLGRIDRITHKDTNYITYAYSITASPKSTDVTVTDETHSNSTTYRYKAFGEPDDKLLWKVHDAIGIDTQYTYNIIGKLTKIDQYTNDQSTITRQYSYYGFDPKKSLVQQETTPEKGTTTYDYYNNGLLKTKSDGKGTKTYSYDGTNRLTSIADGAGNTIQFDYQAIANRISNTVSGGGASIAYGYDNTNRLQTKTETISGKSYTTTYGYDGNDHVNSITYPSGRIITYAYDIPTGRVKTVKNNGVNLIDTINYYTSGVNAGQLDNLKHSKNSLYTKTTYTNRNLLDDLIVGTSVSVGNRLSKSYTYYNTGNMWTFNDNNDASKNQTFGYDALNRLNSFSGSWGSGSFAYYNSGNRKTKTVAGSATTYTYDPTTKRLSSATGGDSWGYNADGDATTYNTYILDYDNFHHMYAYRQGATPIADFDYDGDGMRVAKSAGGSTVIYHYDQNGRMLAENADDASKTMIADYVYLHGKLAAKIINAYTVTATITGGNGGLDASTPSPQSATFGGTANFTFNANTGYHVATINGCNGTPYTNADNGISTYTYTTGPISADCTVTATFAINQYKVTPSPGAGGYFTPATQQTVNYNATTSFNITPNSGYHILSISGCGGPSVGPQPTNSPYNSYTTGPITADCTVYATFSNTFTVTPSAGPNGSMSPNTAQQVIYNTTTSFTANAITGYHVATVSGCNGIPYNNASNAISSYFYTTGAITSDCTVQSTFLINQYQVSAFAGPNGSLDASTLSPKTVSYGSSTSFRFNAATGYHVASVSGCGGTTYNNASNSVTTYLYTTGAIIGDCTVQATFAINQYQVTAIAGQNGSLNAATLSPQTISYNGTTSFTFDSNTDYHVGTIDGCWGTPYTNTSSAVTSYSYSTGPITADCTVTASFVINAPVAGFTFVTAPASGKAPLRATFTDTSTPPALQWDWDFGDGSAHSHVQNPVHVYEGSGTFTVTLIATNDGGPSVPSATHNVDVLACDNPQTVKLSSSATPYTSIASALTAANPGDTIQSQAIHFPENVIVDKNITLDGGYDCDLLEKVGDSAIKGPLSPSLSIDTGSATIDGISVE